MTDAAHGDADEAIEAILGRLNRHWRGMGVVRADRATLTADLRAELTAAAADGVPPQQLIGHDVRAFARDLATGAQVRRMPHRWRTLFRAALIGAIPGLVLSWFLIWRWWTVPLPIDDDGLNFVLRYLTCAVVFLVGALYGAHRGLHGDAAAGRTVAAMAALLPIAGGLAIPVTMGFASLVGYSTSAPALAAEAAIVGGLLAGATMLARWWALRPILESPVVSARPLA